MDKVLAVYIVSGILGAVLGLYISIKQNRFKQ
jgi:hypothetical protein